MRGVLMNEQADILCQFQKKYHPDFHLSIYVTQNPEIWRSVLYDIAKNIQIWCEEHGHKVEMISLNGTENINDTSRSGMEMHYVMLCGGRIRGISRHV